MNSTISATICDHALTHNQILKKCPFNKNNVATIKTNKILTRSCYEALFYRYSGADVMKEETKWNNTISTTSDAYTLTHDQIIKKVHSIRIP